MIVRFPHSGHRRGSRANGNAVTPDRLCSASGRAIKRINGWREGLPPTVAVKFRSEGGLHPPGKVSLERKKNTAPICPKLSLVPHFGRYKSVIRTERIGVASQNAAKIHCLMLFSGQNHFALEPFPRDSQVRPR